MEIKKTSMLVRSQLPQEILIEGQGSPWIIDSGFSLCLVVPKALGTLVAYHMEIHGRSKLHTSQSKCEKRVRRGPGSPQCLLRAHL